jgi:transposase
MFGPEGQRLLETMDLGLVYRIRIESLRDLLEVVEREISMIEKQIFGRLKGDLGYEAIQAIHGVGPIMGAVFVAEIGDVTRFTSARHLCSWAGLTPSHKESDKKIRRGHITKQGSNLVRWAAVECVARYHGGDAIDPAYRRIAKRRGTMIARVAAARKLLTLVYYGLRDGHIRCLAEEAA